MHIRNVTRRVPAPAFNAEQVLFLMNGVVSLITTLLNAGNTATVLVGNIQNLLKPAE